MYVIAVVLSISGWERQYWKSENNNNLDNNWENRMASLDFINMDEILNEIPKLENCLLPYLNIEI